MAARLRIVAKNLAKSASVVATSEVGNMLASNLKKANKNSVWRASSKQASLKLTFLSSVLLSAVALPFCNLSPTAMMRVRATNEKSATNLLTDSEGSVASLSSKSGALSNTGPIGNFANWIRFAAGELSYAYREITQPPSVGTTITFSFFIVMDDGGTPIPGASINQGDFSIVCHGDAMGPTNITIQNLGGGVYRVAKTTTVTRVSGSYGVVKRPTQGGRALRVTGYMLELGDKLSSYYPSLETFTSRASVGTYIGSDGLIKSAAANTPRMQYDPMNPFAPPRLLLEAAATNYCKGSEILTGWTGAPVRVTSSLTYKGIPYIEITKIQGTMYEYVRSPSFNRTTGTVQTLTVALRAGTSDKVSVGLYNPTTPTWGLPAECNATIISGPGAMYGTDGVRDIIGLSKTEDTVVQITRLHTATAADAGVFIYPGRSSSTTVGDSILATRVQVEDGSAVYGPELVTNGTFDTNTTGWTPTNATLSVVGGKLRVTGTSGSIGGVAEQSFPTVIGKLYEVTTTCTNGSNNGYYTVGASSPFMIDTSSAAKQYFVATATTTKISMRNGGTAAVGAYAEYDNVTIREVMLVPVVTSYIPTTTAAATRAADVYTSAPGVRPDGYIDHWQSYDTDTGWVKACTAPGVTPAGMTDAEGASAYAFGGGNVARAWFAPSQVTAVTVDIKDDNNLQGYVEAAMLVVGEYWSPARNPSWGNGLTPIDRSKNTVTEGGTLKSDRRTRSKKLSVNLNNMEEVDRSYMADLLLRCGVTEPIFFCLFPESDDPKLEQHYTIMGKVSTLSAMTMPYWNASNAPLELEQV